MYRRCGPDEALIVSGGQEERVVLSGGTWFVPVVHRLEAFDLLPISLFFSRHGERAVRFADGARGDLTAMVTVGLRKDPASILNVVRAVGAKRALSPPYVLELFRRDVERALESGLSYEKVRRSPAAYADEVHSRVAALVERAGYRLEYFGLEHGPSTEGPKARPASGLIKLPGLAEGDGETGSHGGAILAAWLVEEDQEVEAGQRVVVVETDKVVVEVEAPTSGVLLKQLVAQGATLAQEAVLAVVGERGADWRQILRREAPDAFSPLPDPGEAPALRLRSVSVLTSCRACGSPLPINALRRTVRCEQCLQDQSLPDERWKSILDDVLWNGRRHRGEERQGWKVDVEAEDARPRCFDCGTALPDALIATPIEGEHGCAGCGAALRIARAPEWVRMSHPTLQWAFCERPPRPAGARPLATPILLNCPGCNAGLELSGSFDRLVRCQHCQRDVFLPEDLWRRVRPVEVRRTWFLGVGRPPRAG